MTIGKTTVRWSEWTETWRHVYRGGFGTYEDHERQFDSEAEGKAFAEGLRTNQRVRDIEVATKVRW